MGEGGRLCTEHAGCQHGRQVLPNADAGEVPRDSGARQEMQFSRLLYPTATALIPVRGVS